MGKINSLLEKKRIYKLSAICVFLFLVFLLTWTYFNNPFDKKNYNVSNDNNNDKLQKAIDKIRDKYGDNKILYADEIKK